MNRDLEFHKSASNFFTLALALLIVLFIRWFQLSPLIFENVLGFILLSICLFLVLIFRLNNNRGVFNNAVFVSTLFSLFATCWCLLIYIPSVVDTIRCNKVSYYISTFHPFGDYQWTEYRLTKWSGFLNYETFFFGYAPGGGPFEFICDKENNGVNILTVYPSTKVLHYSYGDSLHSFLHAVAKAEKRAYTVAEDCLVHADTYCEVYIYTLYECDPDLTSCEPLPIQYTSDHYIFGDFKVVETTSDIQFYDDFGDEAILIFTYGDHPRCHVGGCEILE